MAAFARPPTRDESRQSEVYIASMISSGAPPEKAWSDFAHALLNSKEFLYLR